MQHRGSLDHESGALKEGIDKTIEAAIVTADKTTEVASAAADKTKEVRCGRRSVLLWASAEQLIMYRLPVQAAFVANEGFYKCD